MVRSEEKLKDRYNFHKREERRQWDDGEWDPALFDYGCYDCGEEQRVLLLPGLL